MHNIYACMVYVCMHYVCMYKKEKKLYAAQH